MLKEIQTDTELISLRSKSGYILNIDSINKVIRLHTTRCRFCNPNEKWGIQVESKKTMRQEKRGTLLRSEKLMLRQER